MAAQEYLERLEALHDDVRRQIDTDQAQPVPLITRVWRNTIGQAQLAMRRPSELVHTNELPPILPGYAGALQKAEQRLEDALVAYAAARTSAVVVMHARDNTDALPAYGAAVREVLAPPPADLELWGNKALAAQLKNTPFALDFDDAAARQKLEAALLLDFAQRAGIKADGSLDAWLLAREDALEEATTAWQDATVGWRHVIERLGIASIQEQDAAVAAAEQLAALVENTRRTWIMLVAQRPTLEQLARDAKPMLEAALNQIDDIAAAYAAALPTFMPSDEVPGAPASRGPETLFTTTPAGAEALSLLQAARPVVSTAALRFVKTLPPTALAASTTLSLLPPRGPMHALDRVQQWVAATGSVPDGGRAYDAVKAGAV
jgi:hypothetical protein